MIQHRTETKPTKLVKIKKKLLLWIPFRFLCLGKFIIIFWYTVFMVSLCRFRFMDFILFLSILYTVTMHSHKVMNHMFSHYYYYYNLVKKIAYLFSLRRFCFISWTNGKRKRKKKYNKRKRKVYIRQLLYFYAYFMQCMCAII